MTKERLVYIYVMSCPHTHEIRYVGYTTKTLSERLRAHVHKARSGDKTHRSEWIRSLHPFRPVISAVVQVPESSVDESERYWIKYFRETGCDLTNHSPGGKGTLGIKWDADVVEKRAAKLRGKSCLDSTKTKISQANTGKKRTEESKKRVSDAKKGKKWSEAQWESHYARHGKKSEVPRQVFCILCRRGPFTGLRGMYRHYEKTHDSKLSLGSYS